ncbi:MAG: hypothetical protein ABDK94_02380 [Atribacterota bacterium]
MKRQTFFVGIMVLAVLFWGIVFAQEEINLLEEVKALLTEGELEEAQQKLEVVRLSLWNKLPMRVEKATFVEERTQSFGAFRKRASNVFAKGETIFVYGEPKNYTILNEDDLYHIFFVMDFHLYDREGNELTNQKEFGSFRYITQSPIFGAFLDVFFNSEGLEVGDYILEVVVRDKFSEKSANFRLPFKIR